MFNWHKKEKPILSLLGLGGGIGSKLIGGGIGGGDHSATGATIFDVESGGRAVIQFNTPGSITFGSPMSGRDLRIILVGGGGGGGFGNAGGGGAGGMIEITASTISSGTYPVIIGGGGSGAFPSGSGADGSNSTFGPGLTAYGGGRGIGQSQPGGSGGSGGGAGAYTGPGPATQPGFSIPGSYTGSNYGNAGADDGVYPCGGGGGAGSAGGTATGNPAAVNRRVGGSGRTIPAPNFPGVPFSGQLVGGGGGGSDRYSPGNDTSGPGGGGTGCSCEDGVPSDPVCAGGAANGTANTGGGGGGSRCSAQPGGNGGGGLCIVSYSLT